MGKKKYVVTGYVKTKGYRDVISKPMTKIQGTTFKKALDSEMRSISSKYRWVKEIRVEEM